jgi:hypothetical protein
MTKAVTPLEMARANWGEDLPDWIETLAIECGRTSQIDVARKLERSGAVISQVLRNKYPAETGLIEERVRGVFLAGQVSCPGLGEIPTHECQNWREKSRTFAMGNPTRLRMYRACSQCPRNKAQKETAE